MAVVSVGAPTFSIEDGDDLDLFIDLYIGYLNALGIDPYAVAGGPPNGRQRAMGILRACLKGSAAQWFDDYVVGKNWKIANILSRGGANMGALRALVVPEGAGGPNANTYLPGSQAQIYATTPANAGHTIGASLIPGHDLIGGDPAWERSGGQPTRDPVNATNANDG
jgi:hypothetical protein